MKPQTNERKRQYNPLPGSNNDGWNFPRIAKSTKNNVFHLELSIMQSDRREKLVDSEQSFRAFRWNGYRPLTRGHSLGKNLLAIFNIITRNYKSEERLLITLRYGENGFLVSYCQRWYTVKGFSFQFIVCRIPLRASQKRNISTRSYLSRHQSMNVYVSDFFIFWLVD